MLVVPHITDAIQEWVVRVAKIPVSDSGKIPEVCIIELGGTLKVWLLLKHSDNSNLESNVKIFVLLMFR
jgi:hypothetical protein